MSEKSIFHHHDAWVWVGLWILGIYGTLAWVRPVCEFLKVHTPFSVLVNLLFAALFLTFLLRYRDIFKNDLVLTLTAAALSLCTGILLYFLKLPEERIHLLEYAILAALLYRAIRQEYPKGSAYGIALFLGSLVGWGDEIIQDILPNRYFQVSDILLNEAGIVLGLGFASMVLEKPIRSN